MKVNWIVAIFIVLTDTSSRLRQILWRWVYNRIALRDVSGKFVFMNYGYHDENAAHLPLDKKDEQFRYFIQLYNYVVGDIDLRDRDVMEVGCGRGGGGVFLLHYKKPRTYVGIDLSDTAIVWCKNQYPFANANWMQGFADALPVPENSVDVVINVESSHCYPDMEKFLREVKRTLRSNGYLAFCDLRRASDIENLDINMAASGLQILKRSDITLQVLNALDHVSHARDAQINSVFPAMFRRAARDFAGVKETAVYNMLKTGEMKYVCYLLQKKESDRSTRNQ